MAKFKVGDKVIANEKANDRYGVTKQGWVGIVTEYNKKNDMYYVKGEGKYKGGNFWIDGDYFDLLIELDDDLKIGDVVETKEKNLLWKAGAIGVIQGFYQNQYCVDFFIGIKRGHDCSMPKIIPDNTGLLVTKDELIKVNCKTECNGIHIGDRIKMIKNYGDGWVKKGSTGTVVAISDNDYAGIRFDISSGLERHTLQGKISVKRGVWIETGEGYFEIIHHILGEEKTPVPTVPAEIVEDKPVQVQTYTKYEQKAIDKIRRLFKSKKIL